MFAQLLAKGLSAVEADGVRAWWRQEAAGKAKAAGGGGLLSSFVRNLGMSVVGTAALTREDIQPALDALKLKLRERNVASEIADKCVHSSTLAKP